MLQDYRLKFKQTINAINGNKFGRNLNKETDSKKQRIVSNNHKRSTMIPFHIDHQITVQLGRKIDSFSHVEIKLRRKDFSFRHYILLRSVSISEKMGHHENAGTTYIQPYSLPSVLFLWNFGLSIWLWHASTSLPRDSL